MVWLKPPAIGSVASFRLRRFVLWSLPLTYDAKEESDDGDQLQRGPFSTIHYSDGRALVSGVSLELSPCRRIDGRAWGADRPCDHPTLGREIQPPTGSRLPSAQAPGVGQLADGRDVHQGEGPVALSVSGGG